MCKGDLGTVDYVTLTPSAYNSRTTVHEYGGGAFCVYDETVYFSNFADQHLYMQKGDAEPVVLTDKAYRYADGFYCPTVCIYFF